MSTQLNSSVRGSGRQGGYQYAEMVERRFDVVTRTGAEWMAFCAWHDNTNSPALSINVETGNFICFNEACGAHGGPKALRKFCGESLEDQGEYDLAEIRARLAKLTNPDDEPQLMVKDESFLRRFIFPTNYWKDRGFNQRTIDAFELGYDPMEDHAIIPLRNRRGELLGVIRRDLDPYLVENPKSGPKYLNPKHFKKSRDLFASWFAEQSDSHELVLVEGPVDCMMVWQAGFTCVSTFGNHISAEQVRMIRRMGFSKIILFYDNDAGGRAATKAAMGETTRMWRGRPRKMYDPDIDLRRDFLVHQVKYRTGWSKDPGALDTIQIATAIVSSKRVA